MVQREEYEIRKLKILEVPKLLKFRAQYDYKIPFMADSSKVDKDSSFYHMLKMLWHGERMITLVAVRGAEVLGYISIVFGKYKKFYGNAYIVSAAVRSDQRGRGIGSKLFDAIENHARERGARRIEFDVFAKNKRALELYKRMGYEVEGVKRRAVENRQGSDDLVFMAKFL